MSVDISKVTFSRPGAELNYCSQRVRRDIAFALTLSIADTEKKLFNCKLSATEVMAQCNANDRPVCKPPSKNE